MNGVNNVLVRKRKWVLVAIAVVIVLAALMYALVVYTNVRREKAYDTVQPIAMKALEEKMQYQELLKLDETISSVLTNEEIDECFTLDYYMKNVDYIFNRLGIK